MRFFLLFPILFLFACDDSKEQALVQREADLTRREQLFNAKEAEYQYLLHFRDSIEHVDSIAKLSQWPEGVQGQWSSKIVCVESSCTEYVIGDVRNDIWEFAQDSLGMVMQVYNNKKDSVRTYSGQFNGQEIRLTYATDTAAQKFVEMNVVLNEITANKIAGRRSVTVNGKCTAHFSVELIKTPIK